MCICSKNAHFEIVKWAYENGCDWNYMICEYAMKNKHFEIYEWAIKNAYPSSFSEGTCGKFYEKIANIFF
jgi:hypothetical protein